MRRRTAIAVAVAMAVGGLVAARPATAAARVERTAGDDRYATAAALSELAFPERADAVFVGTGTGYADALAGAPVATAHGAPILLTAPGALPAVTTAEIRRLAPSRIVVLGGSAAVSEAVLSQLSSLAPEVFRVAGADRFETAAALGTWMFEPGVAVVHVASGRGFADALAGGAAGGHLAGPVLLVEPDAVPAATARALDELDPGAIRVLGGAGAVSDAVVAALGAYGAGVSRIAGSDRYATAAMVSAAAFEGATDVFVATGRSFADALAAGAAAGALDAPLLLSGSDCLASAAADEIDRLDPGVVHLVGGEGALGSAVAALTRCDGGSAPGDDGPVRATSDRASEIDADRWRLHVVYAVPSDGEDRELDVDGRIVRSVSAFQTWLATQTGGSRLTVDTYLGAPDVTFVRLGATDAEIAATGAYVRNTVEALLEDAGFDEPRTLYAVYYDGSSTYACGGGALPPTIVGRAAVMYLRAEVEGFVTQCGENPIGASSTVPGYIDISMLHEIIHTIGIVGECAPNHTPASAGHVSDSPTDLMYTGSEVWLPSVLDIGRDDYWQHGDPDCPDLARSVFLDPLPPDAEPPPAWP